MSKIYYTDLHYSKPVVLLKCKKNISHSIEFWEKDMKNENSEAYDIFLEHIIIIWMDF